jgi:hypothetical protein
LNIFRSTLRAIATAATLCAVAISFAAAQSAPAHPDFSGTWILDLSRSDSSTFNPKSATWTVVQRGDSIVLDRETPAIKMHAVYALNGAPRKNTLRLIGVEAEATSIVSWTGATMVIRTTSHPTDTDLVQTDSWTLSADGKELRMKREVGSPGSSRESPKWVFVRK